MMGVHKGIILSMLILLFLAACSEKTFVCNPPYIHVGADCCLDIDDDKICDTDEDIPEEEPEPIEELELEEEPDPTIDNLITIYNTRVKSLAYSSPVSEVGQAWVSVRGNRMKIEPSKPLFIEGEIIDLIYLNDLTQTAYGQCKAHIVACRDPVELKLDYHQYREKTPVEWLQDFKGQTPEEHIQSAEVVNNRLTDLYVFRQGKNKRTKLYIDQDYKVPIKVVVLKQPYPVTYLYNDMTLNTVTEQDVLRQ